DLVLVNRGEAVELAGGEGEEAARELPRRGADAVVLTLGPDGAAFFSADNTFCVATPQVIAIDTVGAGDVFCGSWSPPRFSGATGETHSPPQPKPLRFRSHEKVFLAPFPPVRRWRVFLNVLRADAVERFSNDRSRASAREPAHSHIWPPGPRADRRRPPSPVAGVSRLFRRRGRGDLRAGPRGCESLCRCGL